MSEPADAAAKRTTRRPSGNATTVVLEEADAASVETAAAALPDPAALSPGTLLLVPSGVKSARSSLARSVLAAFGRAKTAPRSVRCTALVVRGYVEVGAGDDAEHADLAWGRAPGSAPR